jgi:hypothetical protein
LIAPFAIKRPRKLSRGASRYPHPTSNTTALLKAQFEQQLSELPDDDKPVMVEEFFPLSLSGASLRHYVITSLRHYVITSLRHYVISTTHVIITSP